MVECAEQFTGTAGVIFGQLARIETGVGHVAAAATGDADFLEDLSALFKNGDALACCQIRKLQRREKP